MNKIDRLILKAQHAARSGLELSVALIERTGDSWTDEVHLSDRAMSQEYPNSRDVPIIVDDLG